MEVAGSNPASSTINASEFLGIFDLTSRGYFDSDINNCKKGNNNLIINKIRLEVWVNFVSEINSVKSELDELKNRVNKLEEHIKEHETQGHHHTH